MSRIGKQIIGIPNNVTVTVDDGGFVTVKGPHGELTRAFDFSKVKIIIDGNEITALPTREVKQTRMLWGTYMSHIKNMIDGVVTPFVKKLTIEGVGYKAEVSGAELKLALGFSHPVIMAIPDGITATVEKNNITITGIDKERVGQLAAVIRAKRKPEPYKGKGIRYENEVVRRKQGKKAVS